MFSYSSSKFHLCLTIPIFILVTFKCERFFGDIWRLKCLSFTSKFLNKNIFKHLNSVKQNCKKLSPFNIVHSQYLLAIVMGISTFRCSTKDTRLSNCDVWLECPLDFRLQIGSTITTEHVSLSIYKEDKYFQRSSSHSVRYG